MPTKPRKYGVKFFRLCEATTGFALKSMVYSGRESDSVPHRNLADDVVMKLCSVYFDTGRDIYVDRFLLLMAWCRMFCSKICHELKQLCLIDVKYHRSSKQPKEERLRALRHCVII